MNKVSVFGGVVKVGDAICFMSDLEESGVVQQIGRNAWGDAHIIIYNPNGFESSSLAGRTLTIELAANCWTQD